MIRNFLRLIMFVTVMLSLAILLGFINVDGNSIKIGPLNTKSVESQTPIPKSISMPASFQGTVDDIILLVNEVRAKEGKPPVKKNELLMEAAMAKAKDMRDRNYMEHDTPDGNSFSVFVEQAGYSYKAMGENLAKGYFSATAVHTAWMESEGHRKNIMADSYDEIGVAVLEIEENGQKNYLAVQHFGSQLRPNDFTVIYTCKKSAKEECEKVVSRIAEIDSVIAEQRKIIKAADKDTADSGDLKKAKNNLNRLEKLRKDFEAYQKECQAFIASCNQWE